MKIVELIIDEQDMFSGIDAISIVESPAIEENFIALAKQKEYKFIVKTEKMNTIFISQRKQLNELVSYF